MVTEEKSGDMAVEIQAVETRLGDTEVVLTTM